MEWADMEIGEGVGWGGERILWGSGILGLIEHAEKPLYYFANWGFAVRRRTAKRGGRATDFAVVRRPGI